MKTKPTAMLTLAFLSAVTIVALLLAGCSLGGPDLTGSWKCEGLTMEITKQGDLYRVVYNSEGNLGNGIVSGKLQDGAIKTGVPMMGDITYSRKSDKLYFVGAELARIKKQ